MKKLEAVSIGTADQYKSWITTVKAATAARLLEDAAVARFGDPGRHSVHLPSDISVADLVETIDGDSATVGGRGERDSLHFRKIGGLWKLDLDRTIEHRTKAETAQVDRKQLLLARMYYGIILRIKSGDFRTADELKQYVLEAQSVVKQAKEDDQVPKDDH